MERNFKEKGILVFYGRGKKACAFQAVILNYLHIVRNEENRNSVRIYFHSPNTTQNTALFPNETCGRMTIRKKDGKEKRYVFTQRCVSFKMGKKKRKFFIHIFQLLGSSGIQSEKIVFYPGGFISLNDSLINRNFKRQ